MAHTKNFQEPGLQDPEVQKSYYFIYTGLIAQNVCLFAAATGLAAWFHNCDKTGLAESLGLGPGQRALFAQSVGFPRGGERPRVCWGVICLDTGALSRGRSASCRPVRAWE